MKWINFLHFYQPANSDAYLIKEATEKSYLFLLDFLEKNPRVRFTVNITGCLILRWRDLGYGDLIKRFKRLAKKGQIELTGSVAYHCLMPLTPAEEVRAQIKENDRILRENFGRRIDIKGFFMPEMAYSEESARMVRGMGFEWLILDEFILPAREEGGVVYRERGGLEVVFRDRGLSRDFVPKALFEKVADREESVIITATDAELYGLRYNDNKGYLRRLAVDKNISTGLISDMIKNSGDVRDVSLKQGNWESTKKELADNKPYYSWYDPENEIHIKLWEMADLAYNTVNNYKNDPNYDWARWHLVRGFASCTFWWASGKDFSYIYGPVAWSPDEIERGVNELVRSVRSLESPNTKEAKMNIEELNILAKEMIWKKHWRDYWNK
jgi:predicted glycosyl hydrolase (DUF1957 family)